MPQTERNIRKGKLYGIIAALTWVTIWPLSKIITTHYSSINPFFIAFVRFFSAAIAIFCIFLIKRERAFLSTLKNHWRLALLLGFFGIFGMGSLVFFSIKYTSSVNSALLMNSNAMFIIVFSVFIGEKITPAKGIGALLGVFGCYLIINNGFGLKLFSSTTLKGDLLALGAAVCWAIYTVVGRARVKNVNPTHISALNFFFGSLMILALTFILGVPATGIFQPVPFSMMLYIGLIPTAYGFTIWYYALEHVEAGALGLYQFLVPLLTAIIGVLFLNETFTVFTFFGMVAILSGIILTGIIGGEKPAGD